MRQGAHQRGAGFHGQLREAFGHLRQGRLVKHMAAIDQAIARFAREADAFGDAGQEWNQRRLERIGQDVGALVAGLSQLRGQVATGLQREFAMNERAVDDGVDFRHALKHRGDPARGKRIEPQARIGLVQPHEQRLRHDGVANPGRRYNQRTETVRGSLRRLERGVGSQ